MATKKSSPMLQKHIASLKKVEKFPLVEAGWFESDRYPAAEGKTVGMQVAAVAKIQEYGATIVPKGPLKNKKGEEIAGPKNAFVIPARPFMRKAAADFAKQRITIQTKIAGKVIRGEIDQKQAMGQIGIAMENAIVRSIRNGGWQKNAPDTVKKKGFDKPLIDTAHMWKSVNSKVS